MSSDWWNNAAQIAIEASLGYVPYAGGVLSALVGIFWPSGQDVWDQIRGRVEALIDQKLAENVYQTVKNDLTGLQNVINDYLDTIKTKDPARISASWTSAQQIFDYGLPHFQSQGYELLLLPLLAGFGNLYFSLLRDGVLFGKDWGWNPASIQQVQTKLTNQLASLLKFVQDTYGRGLSAARDRAGTDLRSAQPWRGMNAFTSAMTVSVLDFTFYWPYFDPIAYPNPVKATPNREIFSDPYGTLDKGTFAPPGAGGKTIATITVWGWDRIDAVKVDYTDGSSTGRMGDQNGGSNVQPAGGVFQVNASDPFTVANPFTGDIVNALQLFKRSGWNTGKMAGYYPGGTMFDARYTGEIITSIYICGTSSHYGSADCITFGFRIEPGVGRTVSGLQTLYTSSPCVQHHGDVAEFLRHLGVKDEPVLAAVRERVKSEGWEFRQKGYHAARKLELDLARRRKPEQSK